MHTKRNVLLAAFAMALIGGVVWIFVTAKSNATTPLDYTQGIETTQQVR